MKIETLLNFVALIICAIMFVGTIVIAIVFKAWWYYIFGAMLFALCRFFYVDDNYGVISVKEYFKSLKKVK